MGTQYEIPNKTAFRVSTLEGSYRLTTQTDRPVSVPAFVPCYIRESERLILVDELSGDQISLTRENPGIRKPGWKNITIDSKRLAPGSYSIVLKRLQFPFNRENLVDFHQIAQLECETLEYEPVHVTDEQIARRTIENQAWMETWAEIKCIMKRLYSKAFFDVVAYKMKPNRILHALSQESSNGRIFKRFWSYWKPLMTNSFEEVYLPEFVIMGRKKRNSKMLKLAFEAAILDVEEAKTLILLIMQQHNRDLLQEPDRPMPINMTVAACLRMHSCKSLPYFFLEDVDRHPYHELPKTYMVINNLDKFESPNYDGHLNTDEKLHSTLPNHMQLPLEKVNAHIGHHVPPQNHELTMEDLHLIAFPPPNLAQEEEADEAIETSSESSEDEDAEEPDLFCDNEFDYEEEDSDSDSEISMIEHEELNDVSHEFDLVDDEELKAQIQRFFASDDIRHENEDSEFFSDQGESDTEYFSDPDPDSEAAGGSDQAEQVIEIHRMEVSNVPNFIDAHMRGLMLYTRGFEEDVQRVVSLRANDPRPLKHGLKEREEAARARENDTCLQKTAKAMRSIPYTGLFVYSIIREWLLCMFRRTHKPPNNEDEESDAARSDDEETVYGDAIEDDAGA